jgi:hypothetical protein
MHYKRWLKKAELIERRNPDACTTHPGKGSELLAIEQELLRFAFELREKGGRCFNCNDCFVFWKNQPQI